MTAHRRRMSPPRLVTLLAALLLTPLALAGCLEPTPGEGSGAGGDEGRGGGGSAVAPADPRAEALAFSLRVVETYFTGDYSAFRGMLAERVYTLEGEGPYTREDVDAFQRGKPHPSGRDYRNVTLRQYLDAYAPEALTFDEVRAQYPEVGGTTWEGWTPGPDDYVFLGAKTKEGREPFLWDDLLAFAVSRGSGEWRFKAFSG